MMVKVCGMRDAENIAAVARTGFDMMGFIFYERSPRNACTMPPETLDILPPSIKRVGVFVDAPPRQILDTARLYGLDFVQLHGSESPEICAAIRAEGLGVIKAFGIASCEDVARAATYNGTCDYYIFDTASAAHGGTGCKFDHTLLSSYRGSTPFLLSGGLGPKDTIDLTVHTHPLCVGFDINSRFETSPGMKDPKAIEQFIKTIKNRTI